MESSTHPFWDGTHPSMVEWDLAFTALVPSEGKCETMEGELMRAASQIHYDFYNNGFGNNWSGALNYLEKYMGLPKDTLEELRLWSCGWTYPERRFRAVGSDGMDAILVDLLERVLDIVGRGGEALRRNPCDMLYLQYPTDFYDEEEEKEEEEEREGS